jgi:hypothetical protein
LAARTYALGGQAGSGEARFAVDAGVRESNGPLGPEAVPAAHPARDVEVVAGERVTGWVAQLNAVQEQTSHEAGSHQPYPAVDRQYPPVWHPEWTASEQAALQL